MITSLLTSLLRVTLFWYLFGVLVLFFGDPGWAETLYTRLSVLPWIPVLQLHGLGTAAAVQWRLLVYWTTPMVLLWAGALGIGVVVAELRCQLALHKQRQTIGPTGEYWAVKVQSYSLGRLPRSTTPELTGQPVSLGRTGGKHSATVELKGSLKEAVKLLTPAECQLAEELLQLLLQAPEHYAGLGHGVGLLEHTLNVVTEAAGKVTPEFRLPLLAALSHDIGKLITFQPDGTGGWARHGLHSRESARILASLPGFQELPEAHQRALLLAVKYDHAPSKMPELRSERDATTLALRVISALAHADRKATADEKERHLERLKPEDLLWKDFVDFLREAPVVQRGKKGAANQVNNPPDSPYLFVYEAPWREAAVRRLPPEVAAALDLTRRDAGKTAKYTRILVERLRKEGLLIEEHLSKDAAGSETLLEVSEANPLWDIQSGTGEKAVVLRGILVLKADDLWKKLNYRISIKSPFPVQILAPNANADGRVNSAPRANRDEPLMPDISDGLTLPDVQSSDAMAALGLTAEASQDVGPSAKPKTRARGGFRAPTVVSPADDAMFGLKAGGSATDMPTPAAVVTRMEAAEPTQSVSDSLDQLDREAQELAEMAEAMQADAQAAEPEEAGASVALDNAMAFLAMGPDEPTHDEGQEPPSLPAPAPDVESTAAEPPATTSASAVAAARVAATQAKKLRPAPDIAAATAVSDNQTELSRAEKREGLAVADALVLEQYPNLQVGDKYYTEHSRAVQAGLKKPGSRYKGDSREKALDLTESGPRRGRRRLTS